MTQDYASRLRIPLGKSDLELFTPNLRLFSVGYERVVIGGRGPYIEFTREQIRAHMNRVDAPHFYFIEWRTACGIKVYDQLHRVDYADYLPGMLYVSPFDLRDVHLRALIDPRDGQGRLF